MRLLLVHAHPDDETLTCGVTMAHHVAAGDEVHLLTCTLGEEGEVIPREFAHLEGDPSDALGEHRLGELTRAMGVLGVSFEILGMPQGTAGAHAPAGAPAADDTVGAAGDGAAAEGDRPRSRSVGVLSRYRDSGMAGSEAARRPEAFVNADLAEAGGLAAQVISRIEPDVLITYDPEGGYGHPDHIQTRLVVDEAIRQLRESGGHVPECREILVKQSWAHEDRIWLQHNLTDAMRADLGLEVLGLDAAYPPSVVDDELVELVVHDEEAVAAKSAALAEHATQVRVIDERVHCLSNDIAAMTSAREGFRRFA